MSWLYGVKSMALEKQIRQVHVERYYPNVLAPAREFKALAKAENPEIQLLWEKFWKWHMNTFVYDLDEQGASRWESMLGLRPKASDSLDERKSAILVMMNAMLPYTYRRMEQILNALCGEGLYRIQLVHAAGTLCIVTNPDSTQNVNKIGGVLRAVIPANLALYVAMEIFHEWEIQHRATIQQIVDTRHCFWNLGNVERARWDGEFPADGTIRGTGIRPDSKYQERQYHTVAMQMYTDAKQRQRWYNIADGSVVADGSHFANGSKMRGLVEHAVTFSVVKNNIESGAIPI